MHDVYPLLKHSDFPSIKRGNLDTVQVNLGYKCNQSCVHCHVNAGPNRKEEMSELTMRDILKFIEKGWQNEHTQVIKYKGNHFSSEICNICRDNILIDDIIYELSDCGHYYHKHCWNEYITQYVKNQYSAPGASLNFTDKQIVTCPTCRHNYDLKHLI